MTAARAMKWFRISVGFGLVINLIFTVPAIFAPRALEDLASFGKTNTVHWLQNVGVLLAIVTTMYIPVIVDPVRYLFITYLVVAGRFAAGVLFLTGVVFGNYPSGMATLAGSDLVLSTLQAGLLYFALRGRALSLWGEAARPAGAAPGAGRP